MPQITVEHSFKEILEKRALALAAERGIKKIPMPQYIAEASKFFEDNRPKSESPS